MKLKSRNLPSRASITFGSDSRESPITVLYTVLRITLVSGSFAGDETSAHTRERLEAASTKQPRRGRTALNDLETSASFCLLVWLSN